MCSRPMPSLSGADALPLWPVATRASGEPTPGVLYLLQGQPNPNGAPDAALYLLAGDATAGPITEIIPAPGVQAPPSLLPLDRPVGIKLLHFNDFHSHVSTFTTQEDVPVFSRIASWLRGMRACYADDPQAVVLAASGGDESGGSIFDALLGAAPESYQVHAGYQLYSAAGIDIGVLGNHDLDRGVALLAHAIRQDVRFSMLAANVTGSPELAACCFPAALFVVKGVRIGFIGLVTPAQIRPEPNSLRRVTDPVEAVLNLIPAVRPLCDVLVVLSHLGYSLNQHSAVVQIAGDVELARSLPAGSVHLIVGAHTHHALNEAGLSAGNIVNGIPIVQAGKFGQFAGEVDIAVHETVTVTHARLRALIDLPVDEVFEREHVQPFLARVRPYRDRIIGRVADDPDLSTDAVRNSFAAGESAFANFIADALAFQAQAHGCPVDFAMIDGSSVGCGLPLGQTMTFGDWFEVMPYADTLCLIRLSGRELQALLRDNAHRLDRPGQSHTERGFLHFSKQVRYAIRLDASVSSARAEDIFVNDQPIEDDFERIFVTVTSSFVRGPAGGWETHARMQLGQSLFELQQLSREYTALFVRDLLVEYIAANGGVLPEGGAKRDGRLHVHRS
jgi:5'-nucleotidase / UDP-sugar diphosphatase